MERTPPVSYFPKMLPYITSCWIIAVKIDMPLPEMIVPDPGRAFSFSEKLLFRFSD
jgi:hypothetical protein